MRATLDAPTVEMWQQANGIGRTDSSKLRFAHAWRHDPKPPGWQHAPGYHVEGAMSAIHEDERLLIAQRVAQAHRLHLAGGRSA